MPLPHDARLSPQELTRYSRLSLGRTPLRILCELGCVGATVWASESVHHVALTSVVVAFIATRQHALLVLMHECAHFRATSTRWLNTLWGECIGWLFLMSMRGYRRHHQLHHVERHVNTLKDPDFARLTRDGWHFPMARTALVRALVKDVLLLNTPELFKEARDARNTMWESPSDRAWFAARVGWVTAMGATLFVTDSVGLYGLYWLLPSLSFLKAILRLRALVDHFGLPEDRALTEPTRTVLAPWWERLVLAPCHIGVHHVHHAYPSIPYYHLVAAHRRLWQSATYRDRVRVSESYWRAIADECCPS